MQEKGGPCRSRRNRRQFECQPPPKRKGVYIPVVFDGYRAPFFLQKIVYVWLLLHLKFHKNLRIR